jgi:hypothetical protein
MSRGVYEGWLRNASYRGAADGKLVGMATREQLHREVDALSEPQISRARIIVVDEPEAEDDIVGLPVEWKTFEDGTPQPNWVALLHEARCGRR